MEQTEDIYDKENIFAKILRNEIPCVKVYEDQFCLAFNDINPQAKTHILVIPKGEYISLNDFSSKGSSEEISAFFKAVGEIARKANVEKSGYRIISNHGPNSHQEVPHFHVHILGGNSLGPLLLKSST